MLDKKFEEYFEKSVKRLKKQNEEKITEDDYDDIEKLVNKMNEASQPNRTKINMPESVKITKQTDADHARLDAIEEECKRNSFDDF